MHGKHSASAGCGRSFPWKNVVKMFERGCWEVKWIWRMKQIFVALFIQLLTCWLCNMQPGAVENNWVLSVDQCWLAGICSFVHISQSAKHISGYDHGTWIQKSVKSGSVGNFSSSSDVIFCTSVSLALEEGMDSLLMHNHCVWPRLCPLKSFFITHHNLTKKWFTVCIK